MARIFIKVHKPIGREGKKVNLFAKIGIIMCASKGGVQTGVESSTWLFLAGGCIMRNGRKADDTKEGDCMDMRFYQEDGGQVYRFLWQGFRESAERAAALEGRERMKERLASAGGVSESAVGNHLRPRS